jgi:sugar O-acyltransferase (sialic acid O-acetyltransferase NeuD family)
MILYGASGHAKVIIEIAKSQGLEIDAIIDDNQEIKSVLDIPVHHSLDGLPSSSKIIIAIGDNLIRKKISSSSDFNFDEPLIHIRALLSPSSKIGKGTVVMANATINASTIIGDHCIINTGSTIEHDCDIHHYVHISPNAAIAGGVVIKEGTHIGIGAVVIPGVTIGKWVTIGAGAVIINDIPDFSIVVGNPGRIIKNKENHIYGTK